MCSQSTRCVQATNPLTVMLVFKGIRYTYVVEHLVQVLKGIFSTASSTGVQGYFTYYVCGLRLKSLRYCDKKCPGARPTIRNPEDEKLLTLLGVSLTSTIITLG
jgi:hypothetical protein